jgi:hypothetical protein
MPAYSSTGRATDSSGSAPKDRRASVRFANPDSRLEHWDEDRLPVHENRFAIDNLDSFGAFLQHVRRGEVANAGSMYIDQPRGGGNALNRNHG